MQIFYYAAVGAIVLGAMGTIGVQQKQDTPPAVATAAMQVNKYRTFMYVASQYMKNYSAGAATIPWSTLRTVATVPSGARNMNMPASWKVVAAADNAWVACTDMDERAIGMVQQLAVSGGKTLNPTLLNGASFVVVGGASDVSKAASCS